MKLEVCVGSSSINRKVAIVHGGAKESANGSKHSTDWALVWSLVSVGGRLGKSIGDRTKTWAEMNVRPGPLVSE